MSSASRQISPQPTFCSTLPVISRSRAIEDMRLLSEPPYALETQALVFYYHNFAIKEGPQARLARSRGLASAPSHNALYQSMLALGYAGLSQCASMGESRLQARAFAEKAYIEAVRAVTFAVTRPEETAIDGTLLAVHLMAMYETTAQRRKDVELSTMLSAWSNHVHGAAALLEARGHCSIHEPGKHASFRPDSHPALYGLHQAWFTSTRERMQDVLTSETTNARAQDPTFALPGPSSPILQLLRSSTLASDQRLPGHPCPSARARCPGPGRIRACRSYHAIRNRPQ